MFIVWFLSIMTRLLSFCFFPRVSHPSCDRWHWDCSFKHRHKHSRGGWHFSVFNQNRDLPHNFKAALMRYVLNTWRQEFHDEPNITHCFMCKRVRTQFPVFTSVRHGASLMFVFYIWWEPDIKRKNFTITNKVFMEYVLPCWHFI